MKGDKEQEEFLKRAENLVTKSIDKILNSETFICSMYFLKYIYFKDEKYFNIFMEMFKKLTTQEQIQVMCNVRANLVAQGKWKDKETSKLK